MYFFTTSRTVISAMIVYLTYLGNLSAGAMYAIWSWINDIYGSIYNLVQIMRDLPINFIEVEKYLKIIDKEPEFDESGKTDFTPGDIVLEGLSFKYPKGDKEVMENISLTIPHGKKVAFVGVSGSGKSTIIKLLLRMYDYSSGNIKINQVELKDINSVSLRKNIGYVEQHVDLFDTTIRDNILFGLEDKNVSEEKLQEVIHKARIDQFFHRLSEKGLDTQIGERGVKLSGGERQRIGIARALIKNPDILIFDEATASLDTENEKYIQEAIDESSLGRTSIIIAHRLSTIQNADIIFVMHKGQLVGQGTHSELLQNNEYYQTLVQHQS
jgi:ABC-type multidrug transport system fused ATPase/permease subunit